MSQRIFFLWMHSQTKGGNSMSASASQCTSHYYSGSPGLALQLPGSSWKRLTYVKSLIKKVESKNQVPEAADTRELQSPLESPQESREASNSMDRDRNRDDVYKYSADVITKVESDALQKSGKLKVEPELENGSQKGLIDGDIRKIEIQGKWWLI
ncbi:hypothetical protein R1flu_016361 [Riccia fluitans]|uniref:Uncharacterized protein n=1 Tax=Riccia fluitans TaxID=41844 RepID=A0ABD1YMG0_9MARC